MGSPMSPQLVGCAAALLTVLGAVSFYLGWYWIGLAKLLVATPLDGIAARLARLRMQDGVRQSWWAYLLPLFAGAAFVILAYGLMPAPMAGAWCCSPSPRSPSLPPSHVETEGQRRSRRAFSSPSARA